LSNKKHPYQRKTRKSRNYEVVEIVWPPGAKSPPHDHGESKGMIMVVSGTIYQEVFDKETKMFRLSATYGSGSVIEETPDIIHVMGNASKDEPAKTVHVYTPHLKMTDYASGELFQECRVCHGTKVICVQGEDLPIQCSECSGSGKTKYYAST